MAKNVVLVLLCLVVIALSIVSCNLLGKTTTPAPAPAASAPYIPAAPPVALAPSVQLVPQIEVTKLVRVTGNKYSGRAYNNNWSTVARAEMGDSLEFLIRIRSIGNAPVLNILAEATMPGQMNIQQVNGYSYGGAGNTTVWVDSIPLLAVGETREYTICIILCNSNNQYVCGDNILQSTVKVRGNGVEQEAITNVTVNRICNTYRTPCNGCQYFPPVTPPCTPPCYYPPSPPPPPPPPPPCPPPVPPPPPPVPVTPPCLTCQPVPPPPPPPPASPAPHLPAPNPSPSPSRGGPGVPPP